MVKWRNGGIIIKINALSNGTQNQFALRNPLPDEFNKKNEKWES